MGFTRFDNAILEGMLAHKLSAREQRVLLYVVRESIGRNRKAWPLNTRALAVALEEYRGVVERTIEALVTGAVLLVSEDGLCVNSDTSAWTVGTVAYQQNVGESPTENQPRTNGAPTAHQQIVGKQASEPAPLQGSSFPKERKTERKKESTPHTPQGGAGSLPFEEGIANEQPTAAEVDAILGEVSPTPAGEGGTQDIAPRRARPAPKPRDNYSPEFEAFWQAYPRIRRDDKPKCYKLWKAALASGVTVEEMMTGLRRWLASAKWAEDGGQYVCAPAVWLGRDNRRWESEPPPASSAPSLSVLPDLAAAPVATDTPEFRELLAKPWYPHLQKHIGSWERMDVALMNWAAELGLRDVSRAKTALERDGLRSAGDWVWAQREVV